jgi:transposase
MLHYGRMLRADVVSDELWTLLEPVLPGEPADHALGRSRGGWTTKIHTLTYLGGATLAAIVIHHHDRRAATHRCLPVTFSQNYAHGVCNT